ncbi:60S ribosomal protein L13 [Xylaria digitata]|nr:60S ribosomal protein L13 [Xylaria digitata]
MKLTTEAELIYLCRTSRFIPRQKPSSTHHNKFRKNWRTRVKCHFDQASLKSRRRVARHVKAVIVAPRPIDKLRPVVHYPTIKHNHRAGAGRGFSLTELSATGISRLLAPTIGIAVDYRRVNMSEESLATNIQRLKAYHARLIVFSRKTKVKKDAMPQGIVGGAYCALRLARSDALARCLGEAGAKRR